MKASDTFYTLTDSVGNLISSSISNRAIYSSRGKAEAYKTILKKYATEKLESTKNTIRRYESFALNKGNRVEEDIIRYQQLIASLPSIIKELVEVESYEITPVKLLAIVEPDKK